VRIVLASLSGATMLIAVLAVVGLFGAPATGITSTAGAMLAVPPDTHAGDAAAAPTRAESHRAARDTTADAGEQAPVRPGAGADAHSRGSDTVARARDVAAKPPAARPTDKPDGPAKPQYGRHADLLPLPADSGTGKRIVFSLGHQQVWLVGESGKVKRTYRVSGSKFDQVKVKTYTVNGRYRHATSYLGDATMQYMVTFTRGKTALIGFHAIPIFIKSHKPEQTPAELGKRLSAGCVRQYPADAAALWKFATMGTPVVVVR